MIVQVIAILVIAIPVIHQAIQVLLIQALLNQIREIRENQKDPMDDSIQISHKVTKFLMYNLFLKNLSFLAFRILPSTRQNQARNH